MEERRKELQEIAKDKLPDPIIIIGYLEHQLDLMVKVVSDLASVVDTSTMTQDQKDRLLLVEDFLQQSSVDFDDLSNPLQSYKLPKAKELKIYTRDIQKRYLMKQQKEGLL